MTRGMLSLLAVSLFLLAGCSLGKGYLFEPTGMTKCIVVVAEEGAEATISTPMNAYGEVVIKGPGSYHSVHRDFCDTPPTDSHGE